MLPKINRVKNKKDFEVIFKKGRGFKESCFILKVFKNSLSYSRFAVVCSQKVSKKAVERNKIRRRVSDIIKRNFSKIKKGVDIVFIALPEAKKADYKLIEKTISELLSKAKCLNL